MQFADDIRLDVRAGRSESRLAVDPRAEWLGDHFPGNPLVPGLVMLEAAVRTASALYAGDPSAQTAAVLERVDRLQVLRPVRPADEAVVHASLVARDAGGAVFRAEIRRAAETAMRTQFRLSALPRRQSR